MNLITTTALTMSSQEIADLVGSRHDKVKQSIERLVERGVIAQPPMGDGHKAGNGVVVQKYQVNKRDSFIVVAQLCPEFTARLVDRWQELEQAQQAPALPDNYISALEHLLESKRSEQAAIAQRDHAVATKALIGSKREATAMATASAAAREAQRLKDELGRGCLQATVTAVENATGRKYPHNAYVALRSWCRSHGAEPATVPDSRFGKVKAWPAGAWKDVYQIDLGALFGCPAGEHL